jgi:hypothetical protein
MGARRVTELITRHRVLPGRRAVLVGAAEDVADARSALEGAGATVVDAVPTRSLRRVLGRRRVSGALVDGGDGGRRLDVDLLVIGDRTPNLDLVLAAGAAVTTRDGVLVPVLDASGQTSVPNLSVVGSATGAGTRPAPDRVSRRALVCFCEDVHVDEIAAQVDAGYGDPELVKRRTGALTGPCQGKYCAQAFACVMAASGAATALPTPRPPLRPVRLGDLVADEAVDA